MTWKKLSMIAVPAIALALGASDRAEAGFEFVKNGSFEQSQFAGKSTQLTNDNFNAGVTGSGVTDWDNAGGNTYNIWWNASNATTVDAISQYPGEQQRLASSFTGPAPDGEYFMGLDGDSGVRGALSQAITGLQIGQQYKVDFSWAGIQLSNRTGATTDRLDVSLGAQTLSTATINVPNQGFSGWKQESFVFTATSANSTLSFLSIGTPNGLPPMILLDGVSMQAVPEPATLSMMGIGMLGLGVVRRVRRGKTASV